MELLYAWVEDFRNIHRQGFNFSNQYDINYDENLNEITVNAIVEGNELINENGELKFIESRQHYLKNFFHEKISNITAIIGKNSSGKSNVIDFILTSISSGSRGKLTSKYILVIKKDNLPLFFGKTANNLDDSNLSCMGVQLQKVDPSKEWESMFYSNVADNKDYIFEDSTVHNFSFKTLNKLQSNKIKFVSSTAFYNTWVKLNPKNQDDRKVRFVFNPVAYTTLENTELHDEKIKGILKRYRRAIYDASTSNFNRFKYGITINLLCFLIINENDISPLLKDVNIIGNEGLAEVIATLNPKVSNFLIEFDEYTKLGELSETDFKLYKQLIQDLNITKLNDFGNVEKHVNSIVVDFNENFKQVISDKTEIFNTQSLISHDWSQLSSGMRAYLNLFSQLFYLSEAIKGTSKTLLICIDEGDLYLHPEWQRNFVNDFVDFITTILDIKIQVILTSHSPFLISDLPKESVILLDDLAKPNRKLLDASSFGANIHQLFTNQFFLNEGSIGEFAKNKIRSLLKDIFIMNETDIDLFKKKIEMIGEPILRYRLEEKFNEKMKELSAQTQIQWHKEQIEKLQQL